MHMHHDRPGIPAFFSNTTPPLARSTVDEPKPRTAERKMEQKKGRMLHFPLSLELSGTGSVDEPRHRPQELPAKDQHEPRIVKPQ